MMYWKDKTFLYIIHPALATFAKRSAGSNDFPAWMGKKPSEGVGGPAGPLTVIVSGGFAAIGHHRTQRPALATCDDYTNRSH